MKVVDKYIEAKLKWGLGGWHTVWVGINLLMDLFKVLLHRVKGRKLSPVQILTDYTVHEMCTLSNTQTQLQQDSADPSSVTIFIILAGYLTPHSSWVSTSRKKGKITNDLISGLNLGHTLPSHTGSLPKHQGQRRPQPVSISALIFSALCWRDWGVFAKLVSACVCIFLILCFVTSISINILILNWWILMILQAQTDRAEMYFLQRDSRLKRPWTVHISHFISWGFNPWIHWLTVCAECPGCTAQRGERFIEIITHHF